MNKYIKESLKDHKHKFRNNEVKHFLLAIAILGLLFIPLIKLITIARPLLTNGYQATVTLLDKELQRTNCYDLLQYQKLYPDTELTKQSGELCEEYKD